MEHPHNKIERSLLKIIAWILGIIILLIAGGVLGHRSYRGWQERRLVAQANALVNEGNLKRASLDARRILQINPDSAEGCRIMARISEKASSRSAIDWWRRAVELAGPNTADLLALAKAAVQFDDAANQEYALSRLSEEAKNSAEYHGLSAELASRRREPAELERHLREAVQRDPANKDYAVRLATLQLASPDAAKREEGRVSLTQLQSEPAVRREATRRLIEHAMKRGDFAEAATYAKQLDALPEKTFSDRLLLLTALHRSFDPGFTPLLQELQASAVDAPERVSELISWLNMNQMPAAAITWASQLPPELLTQKTVPIALADSYTAARDWEGMLRIVKGGTWGGMDFLRAALAARAFRETGNSSESTAQWSEAVKKVSANPKQALTLAEIVDKWGWRSEAIELLWVAAKDPSVGDQALQSLYSYFANSGATPDLYRVLLRRQELKPDDLDVQNNVAQLSLLLNMNAERGQKLARDLYEKVPNNPAYASTYAFALHSRGDDKKALHVFSEMTPEHLRQPEVAAYYGIVLASSGDHQKAAEYLDLSEKAGLLPEEKALVERARRTLARR